MHKERSLEDYQKAGSDMRLLKHIAGRVAVDIAGVVSTKDYAKIRKAMDMIDEVCSNADDNMFRDFPELGAEYNQVFYGAMTDDPRSDVDKEQIDMAWKTVNDIFDGKL